MMSTRIVRGFGSALVMSAVVAGVNIVAAPVAQAEDADRYFMTNKTDQPMSMDFKVQIGTPSTGIGYTPANPQMPGQSTSAAFPRKAGSFVYNTYMWGDFCYDHKNWNWPRAEDNTYNHFEIWNPVDRFHPAKLEIHRYYLAQGRADRVVPGPTFQLDEGKPC